MKNKFLKYIIVLCFIIAGTMGAYAFSFRNMTLDLVHLSDTHISTTRGDTSYKALGSSSLLLKDAIEQTNKIKGLDFVLFTGDLVDSATKDNYVEYYRLLSKLKYPTLNAFGNHDFNYGDLTKDEVLDIVKTYNPNYTFSDSYYAFTPKTDYRIIILDGVVTDENTSNGRLTEEQLQFLDNELSQNQDKIAVIALHFPPVEPFVAKEHQLLNADKMNEILIKYKNPIVVLSGHYHAAKIRQIGNIVFVSTPSLVTYPMAFRHIKITNFKDRVNYKFEFLSTNLDEIKEKNRQSVISYSMLAGLEKDRDLEFTYYKKHPKSQLYKKRKIKAASKTQKASKRELKKLEKPKLPKTKTIKPKEEKIKKIKQPKQEKTIKQPKEKIKKVKPIKEEKPKIIKEKNKIKKERKQINWNIFSKLKNKFHFKKTKTITPEEI